MKIFELKKVMQDMNPGKIITVDLDEKCVCAIDVMANQGVPNIFGHLTFNRAKVSVDGVSNYVPIDNHRVPTGIAKLKEKFASFTDVFFPNDILMNMDSIEKSASMPLDSKLLLVGKAKEEADAALANYAQFKKDLQGLSGLTEAQVVKKLTGYRNK